MRPIQKVSPALCMVGHSSIIPNPHSKCGFLTRYRFFSVVHYVVNMSQFYTQTELALSQIALNKVRKLSELNLRRVQHETINNSRVQL